MALLLEHYYRGQVRVKAAAAAALDVSPPQTTTTPSGALQHWGGLPMNFAERRLDWNEQQSRDERPAFLHSERGGCDPDILEHSCNGTGMH